MEEFYEPFTSYNWVLGLRVCLLHQFEKSPLLVHRYWLMSMLFQALGT